MIETAQSFIKKELNLIVDSNQKILVDYEKVQTRTRGSVRNVVGDDRKGQKIRNT